MQDRDCEYCSFREITALVITWNAGASTPAHFRYEENEPQFFQGVLQSDEPPDLLVFGFQELVDLEDKKLTASSYCPCRVTTHLTASRDLVQGEQEEGLFGAGTHEPAVQSMA